MSSLALAGSIFAFVLIGGSFLPLTHDAVLVLAGYYASASGTPAILAAIAACLATLVRDAILYFLSRAGGPIVDRLIGRISPTALERVRARFRAHAGATIILTRLIIGLRLTAAFVAGSSRYPIGLFLLYDAIAVALYVPLLVVFGLVFHGSLSLLVDQVGPIEHVAFIGAAIAVALAMTALFGRFLWRRAQRRHAAALKEIPPQ